MPKNNFRFFIYLRNVRAKTINLLEEDLCDLELGIDFLYVTPEEGTSDKNRK